MKIPPNAVITYEVELLDVTAPPDITKLTIEERKEWGWVNHSWGVFVGFIWWMGFTFKSTIVTFTKNTTARWSECINFYTIVLLLKVVPLRPCEIFLKVINSLLWYKVWNLLRFDLSTTNYRRFITESSWEMFARGNTMREQVSNFQSQLFLTELVIFELFILRPGRKFFIFRLGNKDFHWCSLYYSLWGLWHINEKCTFNKGL